MPVTADFFEITARNWRARLAVSVDLMRELSRCADPDELYQVFTRRMLDLYPTSRRITLSRHGLAHPAVRVMRYNLWTTRNNPYRENDSLPLLSGGLFAELLYADEPRVIDDLELASDDPAADYLTNQRSLLAIPLYEAGVAQQMIVVTREEPNAFPRESLPELVWMANMFSRAIQEQILAEQLREAYDAAEYELRMIAGLQHGLLPARVPQVPGLELAAHYRTANRAGGDYYDFFPLPEGRLGVLIADVSGHGSPAGMLMAIAHSLTHALPQPPERPAELFAHLNTHFARYTESTGHFVTAFYAVFDPGRNQMTFASAGHAPPRVVSAEGRWHPIPSSPGLPLGVMPPDENYIEETIPFMPGDRAVLFTDGVIEARNRLGEPFGLGRLDDCLLRHCPPDGVVAAMTAALDRFTDGCAASDDQTLVVVNRV